MTVLRFLYEVLSILFTGVGAVFKGLFSGLVTIFSFSNYKKIIDFYSKELHINEWVLVVILGVVLLLIIGLIFYILQYIFRKYFLLKKKLVNQESLLEEINSLNDQVEGLVKENEKIAEIYSGITPNSNNGKINADGTVSQDVPTEGTDGEVVEEEDNVLDEDIRFPQLYRIDKLNKKTKIVNYNNTQTLPELIDDFRCFSASQLHLYYNEDLLRVFFGGLACGKMLIFQGISGTGKTSLAYAWSKFNKSDPCISSVQPSWRDRTDFFGYINEFTKRFNETGALVELYSALYDDRCHTIVLDEMNLARVEYYFAEVLSILEMPNRAEWNVALVTNTVDNDPVKLNNGKIRLNGNVWYIGTINNDDSTFAVTDKVYDRAMPIDINTKIDPFDCRNQEALDLNSVYLESLFKKACEDFPVSEKGLKNLATVDNFMITNFKISFGNRIMKQLKIFVPVYVACGGDETGGIDYFVAKKILRKLERQNIAYMRDAIDPFIEELNRLFGKDKMKECIDYVSMLKKG